MLQWRGAGVEGSPILWHQRCFCPYLLGHSVGGTPQLLPCCYVGLQHLWTPHLCVPICLPSDILMLGPRESLLDYRCQLVNLRGDTKGIFSPCYEAVTLSIFLYLVLAFSFPLKVPLTFFSPNADLTFAYLGNFILQFWMINLLGILGYSFFPFIIWNKSYHSLLPCKTSW